MRIVFFILIAILATVVPWYVFLLCAGIYALYFTDAYELIALGLFIDAYFGVTSTIPQYALYTTGLLLVLEWLKPQLLLYNRL